MKRAPGIALLLAALWLASSWTPARAVTVTGARVTFSGEIGRPGPAPNIAAGPGTRLGMELVPLGSPAGAPVVLDVRLSRPGDLESSPPIRFLVAARIGSPVLCAYEFAYDWEATPGVWTMKVSSDDQELASTTFTLVQPLEPHQAAPPPQPAQTPRPETPLVPARAGSPSAGVASPTAEAQPERPKPKPQEKTSADTSHSQAGLPGGRPARPGQSTGASPETAAAKPAPRRSVRPARPPLVGGDPGRTVFVLIGGVYSQEARALWVASFLRERGIKACVRTSARKTKTTWSVVVGWHETRALALEAKRELSSAAGEIALAPMAAGDLESGLSCP